ncbi:hypothetical protein AMTRI_Chr08g165020 [Amborella trichopoda]
MYRAYWHHGQRRFYHIQCGPPMPSKNKGPSMTRCVKQNLDCGQSKKERDAEFQTLQGSNGISMSKSSFLPGSFATITWSFALSLCYFKWVSAASVESLLSQPNFFVIVWLIWLERNNMMFRIKMGSKRGAGQHNLYAIGVTVTSQEFTILLFLRCDGQNIYTSIDRTNLQWRALT